MSHRRICAYISYIIVLPPVPRILAVVLTTFAALTHGAPGTPTLASPDISHLTRAADSLSTCAGTYHLVISDRTSLDRRSAHGTWPLGGGGQRRARCGTRIHRTRQHAHQPPATLVTDALAWRLTWHHLPPQCAQRLVHIAVPASRCHVAKCPIFVARGPGGLMLLSSSSILAHHQSPTAMHAATGPHRHP